MTGHGSGMGDKMDMKAYNHMLRSVHLHLLVTLLNKLKQMGVSREYAYRMQCVVREYLLILSLPRQMSSSHALHCNRRLCLCDEGA